MTLKRWIFTGDKKKDKDTGKTLVMIKRGIDEMFILEEGDIYNRIIEENCSEVN